jgi:copper homeostasis protein
MLEVVVETVEDAVAAFQGGADQVEVKCDYLEFGLTPTAGMLAQICTRVSCNVLSMVRPHARSFVYSKSDVAAMVADIRDAKSFGVDGFLLGCLTPDNEIDIDTLHALRDAAGNLDLHCHLAWESTPDPIATLETLIELGIKSARTSGGQGTEGIAAQNLLKLKTYADHAAGRIELFLAGGIRIDNLTEVVTGTGICNVHTGSGVRDPETRTGMVVEHKVRQLCEELNSACQTLQGEHGKGGQGIQ